MAWIWYACAGVCGLGGLTLLGWSLLGDRAAGRLRCPRCWQQLGPHVETFPVTCPECGRSIIKAKLLCRTRRRWRWAALALLVCVVAAGLGVTPVIQRGEWAQHAPTTVLILAYRHAQSPKDAAIVQLESRFEKNSWGQIKATHLRPWQESMLARQCAAVLEDDGASKARREDALSILPALGPRAVHALDPLLRIIEENRPDEIQDAVSAISAFAPAGERAIPALTALVVRADSTNEYYTNTIIETIGAYGPAASDAVTPLVVMLNNAPRGGYGGASRKAIIRALGRIGPASAPGLWRLQQMTPEAVPDLRADCIAAIGAIDPLEAKSRPLILAGVLDPEVHVREVSASIIASQEQLLAPTLDLLIKGLQGEAAAERLSAARALLSLGSAAAPALAQLEGATRDENRATRLFAIEAIAAIAKAQSKHAFVLESLTQDDDPVVARAARRALR